MSAQKNDEFSRLEAKLAKLRQRERGPGEARFVRGQKERLLAAVVSEVDETILPREIGLGDGPIGGDLIDRRSLCELADQQETAETVVSDWKAAAREPLSTSVEPATTFYRAEEYHQYFLSKRGGNTRWT